MEAKLTEYEKMLEALLFVSGEELPLSKLAAAVELDEKTTSTLLKNLGDKYTTEKRGMILLEANDTFQLVSNPIYFENIKKMHAVPQRRSLTQTLLETLAIIAYRQPVTKGQIEEIRGVNADHAVNKLMEFGLITEKGRQDTPGKPILFGTSDAFLQYFGLKSLSHLPDQSAKLETFMQQALEEVGQLQLPLEEI